MPVASIEAARAARASGSKWVRGWFGFGLIRLTGSSRSSPVAASAGVSGRIAASPRPIPARFLVELATRGKLLRQRLVGDGTPGRRSMVDHRQTIARRLGDSDAPRDDSLEDQVGEVRPQLRLDVLGQPRALVVHRHQQSRYLQLRVELTPDQAEGLEELDEALERQVLGLHRDDHT